MAQDLLIVVQTTDHQVLSGEQMAVGGILRPMEFSINFKLHIIMSEWSIISVSARPEFPRVIDDPLFEKLGVIGKFRGSELFKGKITFCLSMRQY